jgi:hypothetical protein
MGQVVMWQILIYQYPECTTNIISVIVRIPSLLPRNLYVRVVHFVIKCSGRSRAYRGYGDEKERA